MGNVLCFQEVRSSDGQAVGWQEVLDPKFVADRGGRLVAELPAAGKAYPRAFVNGIEVVGGVQSVRPGDLVRVVQSQGNVVTYVVGRRVASREPGEGRTCSFTGMPIRGQAVRCPCGLLMAEEVVVQLGRCPECGLLLATETSPDERPSEEML